MIVDDGLELLTDEECRRLLAIGEVGRVGITIGALPAIFPVNYRVIDGAIVFRTSPGSKLSTAAAGAVVAFEVATTRLPTARAGACSPSAGRTSSSTSTSRSGFWRPGWSRSSRVCARRSCASSRRSCPADGWSTRPGRRPH